MEINQYIGRNIKDINAAIVTACQRVGRNPKEVKLVAVSKNQPKQSIETASEHGITIVGENKVQELTDKHQELQHLPLAWHMIGHLQSNKVKYIVDKVDLVHSVDSVKLAQQISKECTKKEKYINILVQINIADEDSKYGIAKQDAIQVITAIAKLENISIKGLMTMAPYVEKQEEVRSVFRELKQLALQINDMNIPRVEMQELSMGMTNDFEVAVEEGATLVRVGSGIFGQYSNNGNGG